MRMTYDSDADAAYLAIGDEVADGSAVENVVIERPGRGDIVLDFDADGRLLGVEVIGASVPRGFSARLLSRQPFESRCQCSSTALARKRIMAGARREGDGLRPDVARWCGLRVQMQGQRA